MVDQQIHAYSEQLSKSGIENEIVEHPALQAVKDVLEYLHLTFADCLPTLIMKADHDFIAVVFRGDCRADFKKIKKQFGIKDLRLATPEEFTELTGLPIGAARVYTPSVHTTYVDKKVFEKEYLMGGSGSFSCSIKYKTADLTKLPDIVVADITQ
jgi:prolyl-tRNA editing enzyme YbaK/EbsC (Cys-tRNA(Pro) deacylase)